METNQNNELPCSVLTGINQYICINNFICKRLLHQNAI